MKAEPYQVLIDCVTATRLPWVSRMEKCVVSLPALPSGQDRRQHVARRRAVEADRGALAGGVERIQQLLDRRLA